MMCLVLVLYVLLFLIVLENLEKINYDQLEYGLIVVAVIAVNCIVIELLKNTVYNIDFKFNKVIFILITIVPIIVMTAVLYMFISSLVIEILTLEQNLPLDIGLSAIIICVLIIATILFIKCCPRYVPRMIAILILVHCVIYLLIPIIYFLMKQKIMLIYEIYRTFIKCELSLKTP